jgi:Tfp pilus assembly protein PilF
MSSPLHWSEKASECLKVVDGLTEPVQARKQKKRFFLGAIVLIAMILICYAGVFRAEFIWDDDKFVTENHLVADPGGLKGIWLDRTALIQYYPLVFTTFWLEYRLWGLNPAGYHLVNILLHAAGVLLLWVLLRRLAVPGAWLAAAIVAVHPVHVESVAWIAERKNVLAVMFYLLTLLAYFLFDPPTAQQGTRRWSFYPLVLVLFICALLSKSTTSMLPPTLLVILWWKRDRLGWSDITPLIAMVLLGLAAGLNTAYLEVRHVGAMGGEWSLNAVERVMLAGRVFWFYIGKLVWPINLSFIYPRWTIELERWWLFIPPVLAISVVVSLWFARRRIGKGMLTAILVYGANLFPAMGFFNVYPMRYSYVADHFAYPATIGLITLVASGTVILAPRLRRASLSLSIIAVALCGVLLMALVILSVRHGAVFRDVETLWRHTLSVNPHAQPANNNLAKILIKQGRTEEAEAFLRQAIKDQPDYPEPYNNLSLICNRRGQYEEAVLLSTRAIDLMPQVAFAYVTRAVALTALNRLFEAEMDCIRAIERKPNFAAAYLNLGIVDSKKGQQAAELECYNKAIELDPGMVAAYQNRAVIWQERKLWARAQADLAKAMQLQ